MNFESTCVNDTTIRQRDELLKSFFVFVKIDGCVYSLSRLLGMGKNVKYGFEVDLGKITYTLHLTTKNSRKFVARATFTMDAESSDSANYIVDIKVHPEEKSKKEMSDVQIAVFSN